MLWQYVAFAHVSHVARALLMEPNKYAAFFLNMANRQARTMPIAPKRAHNRRKHCIWRDSANSLQIVFKNALFDGNLRMRIEVLHAATAAHAEVRTTRRHAVHACAEHLLNRRLIVARLLPRDAYFNELACERALYEHRFPLGAASNALPFVINGFDCELHEYDVFFVAFPEILGKRRMRKDAAR